MLGAEVTVFVVGDVRELWPSLVALVVSLLQFVSITGREKGTWPMIERSTHQAGSRRHEDLPPVLLGRLGPLVAQGGHRVEGLARGTHPTHCVTARVVGGQGCGRSTMSRGRVQCAVEGRVTGGRGTGAQEHRVEGGVQRQGPRQDVSAAQRRASSIAGMCK